MKKYSSLNKLSSAKRRGRIRSVAQILDDIRRDTEMQSALKREVKK